MLNLLTFIISNNLTDFNKKIIALSKYQQVKNLKSWIFHIECKFYPALIKEKPIPLTPRSSSAHTLPDQRP